ncbi:MAG: glycoside hydrolase family 18 protein [Candidatus Curtissbacteria bacterium]
MLAKAGLVTLSIGVFFLGNFFNFLPKALSGFGSPVAASKIKYEVFGFAPYWSFSKMENVDFDVLTTFAYFSLEVGADGAINKNSYEWEAFNSKKLAELFAKAKDRDVRRVVTLTQMEPGPIEALMANKDAWKVLADDSVEILKSRELDGINIDFEYIPRNDMLREQFSEFIAFYTKTLKESLDDPYITVSVLASSVKENKIYDIGKLAAVTDGIFMMAYDFYYPGSESIGPSAPLYGHNHGTGPLWYDVSTAVDDFLTVAPADKIIMGVPFYGWNYPTSDPRPNAQRDGRASAATSLAVANDGLLSNTPLGGWDDVVKVSWRGYFDENGWHVFYLEDNKSLTYKFDFAKDKKLAGVGIWALGFDSDGSVWTLMRDKFSGGKTLASVGVN